MKSFIISASLFLLLSMSVVCFSLFSANKIQAMRTSAERASHHAISGEDEEAIRLFELLKKEWHAWHFPLSLTVHRNTLKPIENMLTDAENAIALQKNDQLYAALIRLSREFSSLSDSIAYPTL